MFAVVVKVELPEGSTIEQGRAQLKADVIPQVKARPGFVAGYWLAPTSGQDGLSFAIYKDEHSARQAADTVKSMPPVKVVSVEVREVAASA